MGGKRNVPAEAQLTGDGEAPDADGRLSEPLTYAPAGYRYVGPGYIPGVPARDLAPGEAETLNPAEWADALFHGLYVAADAAQEG